MRERLSFFHIGRDAFAVTAVALIFATAANSQTAGLGIHPGRLEIQMQPGTQKTVSFEIESPPADQPVSGRLLLSLTDWNIKQDGSLEFFEAGSQAISSAKWIEFSPSALTISSGRKQMVRVTVTLPPDVKSGEYRTGMFIQERPPATPAKAGQ